MQRNGYGNGHISRISPPVRAIVAIALTVALLAAAVAGLAWTGADSAQTLNNVIIQVQTSGSNNNQFSLSVYNSTGGEVASSESQYPAFGVELPSGTYIFTVVAQQTDQQAAYCPPVAANPGAQSDATSNGTNVEPIVTPIFYCQPSYEYGWQSAKITGSTNLQIQTQNITSFPSTTISVTTTYFNGTPASGATVYASVLGSAYWPDYSGTLSTSNETGPDGTVQLVVPDAPVQVNAWLWIPITLPQNISTVQTNVGGQLVNITVYWEPSYVGLAGEGIILPPQSSATIVMSMQEQNYWVTPVATGAPEPTSAIGASGSTPSEIPSTVYNEYVSSQGGQSTTPAQGSSPGSTTLPTTPSNHLTDSEYVILALSAALAVCVFVLGAIVLRRH